MEHCHASASCIQNRARGPLLGQHWRRRQQQQASKQKASSKHCGSARNVITHVMMITCLKFEPMQCAVNITQTLFEKNICSEVSLGVGGHRPNRKNGLQLQWCQWFDVSNVRGQSPWKCSRHRRLLMSQATGEGRSVAPAQCVRDLPLALRCCSGSR